MKIISIEYVPPQLFRPGIISILVERKDMWKRYYFPRFKNKTVNTIPDVKFRIEEAVRNALKEIMV